MHLYLIRHGESVNPNPQATPNAGLTEKGQQQSLALARWMRQQIPHIHALYASPARRAQETAQFLAEAYSCEVIFDEQLQEGVHSQVDASRGRIETFLNQLIQHHQGERVTVVTHGELSMPFVTSFSTSAVSAIATSASPIHSKGRSLSRRNMS